MSRLGPGPILFKILKKPVNLVFYHHDHLGSTRMITDEDGGVVSTHDFAAYGEEITGSDYTENRMKFTGHERDPETDLDYMLARYYSSGHGRFLQVDPGYDYDAVDPMSWNLYAYVRGNPCVGIDLSGEAVYLINRDLKFVADNVLKKEPGARSRSNYVTHTYVAITDSNGKVINTLSWGNEYDKSSNYWYKNRDEDKVAAVEALKKGLGEKVGGDDLNRYVLLAFKILSTERVDPRSQHANFLALYNCKYEAKDLIRIAKALQAGKEPPLRGLSEVERKLLITEAKAYRKASKYTQKNFFGFLERLRINDNEDDDERPDRTFIEVNIR